MTLRVVGEQERNVDFTQGATLGEVFDRAEQYACSTIINGQRTPIDEDFVLLNGITIEATPRVKAA